MEFIFSPQALIYILAVGFAALVHGAIGIGFPLIATPVLAMITDVKTAILILVLLILSLPLTIWALAATTAGLKIRDRIDTETYQRWLRILLSVMAGVLLIQFFYVLRL